MSRDGKKVGKIKHWELYKRLLAFALLAILSLFYLGHFIVFIINGPVTVGEENKVVLWAEIAMFLGITGLAVDCFIGDIRKKKL